MELAGANLWIILGVALLIIEIFTVTFFAIFFGIGALLTGLLVSLGVLDDFTTQLVVFGLGSLISLYFFRNKIKELLKKKEPDFKEFEDEIAKVSVDIPEGEDGKVFYRGTDWMAYDKNGKAIAKNTKVIIRKVDGIKLMVEAV